MSAKAAFAGILSAVAITVSAASFLAMTAYAERTPVYRTRLLVSGLGMESIHRLFGTDVLARATGSDVSAIGRHIDALTVPGRPEHASPDPLETLSHLLFDRSDVSAPRGKPYAQLLIGHSDEAVIRDLVLPALDSLRDQYDIAWIEAYEDTMTRQVSVMKDADAVANLPAASLISRLASMKTAAGTVLVKPPVTVRNMRLSAGAALAVATILGLVAALLAGVLWHFRRVLFDRDGSVGPAGHENIARVAPVVTTLARPAGNMERRTVAG